MGWFFTVCTALLIWVNIAPSKKEKKCFPTGEAGQQRLELEIYFRRYGVEPRFNKSVGFLPDPVSEFVTNHFFQLSWNSYMGADVPTSSCMRDMHAQNREKGGGGEVNQSASGVMGRSLDKTNFAAVPHWKLWPLERI